jgi:uncharacterized membrane protein
MSVKQYLVQFLGKNVRFDQLERVWTMIMDSRPVQLLIDYREQLSTFLYVLWLAGCGHWIYKVITADAKPVMEWMIITNDPKDAMVFLYFGIFGAFYVTLFAFMIIKLIYNLFQSGIESIFSIRWYSIGKPLSYMLLLAIAFSYTSNIKAAGLTAYYQVSHMVDTSKKHETMVEKSMENLKRLLHDLKSLR